MGSKEHNSKWDCQSDFSGYETESGAIAWLYKKDSKNPIPRCAIDTEEGKKV